MKWIKMQDTYVCPNCGTAVYIPTDRCPACAGQMDPADVKVSWTYLTIKVGSDVPEDEELSSFDSKTEAVDAALAAAEAEANDRNTACKNRNPYKVVQNGDLILVNYSTDVVTAGITKRYVRSITKRYVNKAYK